MKELTIEEKAKAYDEAIKKAESLYKAAEPMSGCNVILETIFPELKESEDERIRKEIKNFFSRIMLGQENFLREDYDWNAWMAWLEKQSKQTSWKPSKEEMDALYGLAYITNKMDDKKDEAITKLYQDLKREFFSGVSYENMFPSSPVDAPILEKQGGQKPADNIESSVQNKPWSEEDEAFYQRLEQIVCKVDIEAFQGDRDLHSWLKSLRPQNKWKPSDEQIKFCKEVYADILSAKGFDLGTVNSELNRMEEQLKKLREE